MVIWSSFSLQLVVCPGFLFAILVNRTLLWDTNDSCDHILDVAEWLPPHSDWSTTLQLADPVPIHAWTDYNWSRSTLDKTPVLLFPDTETFNSEKLLQVDSPLETSRLLEQGRDFLFGMLFSAAFTFALAIRSSTQHPNGFESGAAISNSIAIDARTWSTRQPNLVQCLTSIFDTASTSPSCQAYVLSNPDDQQSSADVSKWLESHNCSVLSPRTIRTSEHRSSPTTISGGDMSYFSQLAWASSARSAYIGPESSLLLQLIQYQRRMEIWKQGRDPPILLHNLTECRV